MADQNKLTVAELLYRNNKARGENESKKDNRSRRHRRSLDEGGISVAELTGNLKKVKASPAEAKHTSVSIDEDAPVIRSPKSAEQAGAEKAVAGKAGADSTKKPAADPAAKPAAKRAAQPAAKAAQTTKPAARPTTKTAAASSATPAAAAPAAQKPAATGAAQDAAKKNQPSADDTAVIQRVDKAGDAKPAAAKPAADTPAAKKPAAEKARAEKPKDDKRAKAAGAGAAAAGAGAAAAAVPASKKAGVAKSAEETGNLPKVENNEDWVEEKHEKLNPVSILLMIVAGILLAIVIFKGFEILWDNFPRLVVAVLALCVTAIMVGVTHALRTARDGFSMFLAGFTGLILTFGPLLLVML